ncbi:uncharacterized protein LOC103384302 isoform X3 [Cynoglossus semilaevis]|uniref:uncharacterized protein LOC103384302 isoform X3 n=1 Tax=Cynoglossus semilaevis TaxID=244447 RepID=UPI000497D3F4|nr:uncharacterized protein LOC103384302 isoform X3 [Cynoglossus semilaevis]
MQTEGSVPTAGPRLNHLAAWFDGEVAATIAGGSFTMASERKPSRSLIQGCACGNLVGLLVALIALGLYCYSFNTIKFEDELCLPVPSDYEEGPYKCPGEFLRAISRSIILLLLLDACGAVFLLLLMSASAIRALKTE